MKTFAPAILLFALTQFALASEPVKAAKGTFFRPTDFPSLGVLNVGPTGTITFDTGAPDRDPS